MLKENRIVASLRAMLRLVFGVIILVVGGCVSLEADLSGWHSRIGIKLAEDIKKAEGELVLNRLLMQKPIVGGTIAFVNAHPHLAGIVIDLVGVNGNSGCGGSLITSNRVLTAAHCWYDGRSLAWRFTVVLGSAYLFFGGERIPTSQVVLHPAYSAKTLANDIAMIYLPRHVSFTSEIQPVALAGSAFIGHDFVGHWVVAAGYGRYSDATNPTMMTTVRDVNLKVISLTNCRGIYGNIVLDSNICTSGSGGVGICRGDSGGPLTINIGNRPVLLGVSSFVAQNGCELGFPSAFARVPYYMNWIMKHV
ncbi:Chymotrypsin BI [Eumeta japonica]|uniref:Chymotrypsin BI n=1 Tax=Eumeta variegata TaxID=151549 RepID=A0A4C1W865_EUMVA|nr:Chymotrypsin BI [Eumeta japonica]